MHDNWDQLKAAANWETFESQLRADPAGSLVEQAYVDELLKAALHTAFKMKVGVQVFRARVMPVERQFDTDPLPLEEMGAPPPQSALQGRLNSLRESCFYGALDPDTAVAEVRPWVQARICVAEFVTTRAAKVVDLTGESADAHGLPALSWAGFMITRPIHRLDEGGYVATQYLARRLVASGVGAILYESALHMNGQNLAVFDEAILEGRSAELREVIGVNYQDVALTEKLHPLAPRYLWIPRSMLEE